MSSSHARVETTRLLRFLGVKRDLFVAEVGAVFDAFRDDRLSADDVFSRAEVHAALDALLALTKVRRRAGARSWRARGRPRRRRRRRRRRPRRPGCLASREAEPLPLARPPPPPTAAPAPAPSPPPPLPRPPRRRA